MDVAPALPAAYRPLFPWFGGKSQIARTVWGAIGADVPNYVEPFFGSGATLFLRPGQPRIETINDADGFVANFWRAVQRDPDSVAEHADNPVNECDLHARHLWLIGKRDSLTDRLCGDPEFFDDKVAGWWCWGLCCWIGSGWCSGNGPWVSDGGKMTLGNAGRGVNRQLPHLHAGRDRRDWLIAEIRRFSDRLRGVRVCCGDWSRVCGPTPTVNMGITGVFLDPPYADTAGRTAGLYAHDCLSVAHDVREWAIARGRDRRMRIVLAGYDGEHDMPSDWRCLAWKACGGYASQSARDSVNATRERLWLSPHCMAPRASPRGLFD